MDNANIINAKDITLYPFEVVEGKIMACKLVVLSCQRFISFLQNDDVVFDKQAVERVIKFIGKLKHRGVCWSKFQVRGMATLCDSVHLRPKMEKEQQAYYSHIHFKRGQKKRQIISVKCDGVVCNVGGKWRKRGKCCQLGKPSKNSLSNVQSIPQKY